MAAFAAGCGGGGGAETPLLPRDLAEALAARSDGVAAALDAGDSCRAAEGARGLREKAIEAVNRGRIPDAYHEELLAAVQDLAASTEEVCAGEPAPPPTTEPMTTAETETTETEETEPQQDEDEGDKGEESEPELTLTLPTLPDAVGRGRGKKKGKK